MRALLFILGLSAAIATIWVVGSFVAGFVAPAGPLAASSIALAVGVLSALAVPLFGSARLLGALADRPGAW